MQQEKMQIRNCSKIKVMVAEAEYQEFELCVRIWTQRQLNEPSLCKERQAQNFRKGLKNQTMIGYSASAYLRLG